MRNYVCPECANTKRAPERMRANDVRRFCLACSMSTGFLVARSAPALERERSTKAERTKVAASRKAKAERTARANTERKRRERIARDDARARELALAKRTVAGIDLAVEAERLWRLDALNSGRRRKQIPPIVWRRSSLPWREHTSGSYGWGRGIVVTIGAHDGGAIETLLHELCHAAVGLGHHHDNLFWSTLRSAAREAWPTVDFKFHEGTPNESGWKLDNRIGQGVQRWLDEQETA